METCYAAGTARHLVGIKNNNDVFVRESGVIGEDVQQTVSPCLEIRPCQIPQFIPRVDNIVTIYQKIALLPWRGFFLLRAYLGSPPGDAVLSFCTPAPSFHTSVFSS